MAALRSEHASEIAQVAEQVGGGSAMVCERQDTLSAPLEEAFELGIHCRGQ
jgi:hypothetical protein